MSHHGTIPMEDIEAIAESKNIFAKKYAAVRWGDKNKDTKQKQERRILAVEVR